MRTILHVDMNGFFASVECLYHPELRDKPVAVGGNPELRHGLILAKNELAKKYLIKTGDALWAAKKKCPDLVILPPNYKLYVEFAELAREIYCQYTDRVEPFGMDEAFLDLTGCEHLFGEGKHIADEIRERIKSELGITASIGVSWNKIFAKLGSDMKKPDATTVITPDDYRQKVWPLPVSDLLYVGAATAAKLKRYGISTIGALAKLSPALLNRWFGKVGEMLWSFANGEDVSPVMSAQEALYGDGNMLSVGHSTTTPRDLVAERDVQITVMLLAEAVAQRLREHRFFCRTVQIYIRDNQLNSFVRQRKTDRPTNLAREISALSMKLFHENYAGFGTPGSAKLPIRSFGVRATDLIRDENTQLPLPGQDRRRENWIKLEATMDDVRRRFGHFSISRGMMTSDRKLSQTNPKEDHHTVFPVGWKN